MTSVLCVFIASHIRSPLVQGGMEIACLVILKMPATRRNTTLTEKYLEIHVPYINEVSLTTIVPLASKQKRKREANQPLGKKSEQHDNRQMFAIKKVRNTDVIGTTVVYKYVGFIEIPPRISVLLYLTAM